MDYVFISLLLGIQFYVVLFLELQLRNRFINAIHTNKKGRMHGNVIVSQ